MQRVARCRASRKEAGRRRHARDDRAATAIQCRYRTCRARTKVAGARRARDDAAATRIQSGLRGRKARRRVAAKRKQRETRAATSIQAAHRGRQGRLSAKQQLRVLREELVQARRVAREEAAARLRLEAKILQASQYVAAERDAAHRRQEMALTAAAEAHKEEMEKVQASLKEDLQKQLEEEREAAQKFVDMSAAATEQAVTAAREQAASDAKQRFAAERAAMEERVRLSSELAAEEARRQAEEQVRAELEAEYQNEFQREFEAKLTEKRLARSDDGDAARVRDDAAADLTVAARAAREAIEGASSEMAAAAPTDTTWEEHFTESGEKYWYNTITAATSWERPGVGDTVNAVAATSTASVEEPRDSSEESDDDDTDDDDDDDDDAAIAEAIASAITGADADSVPPIASAGGEGTAEQVGISPPAAASPTSIEKEDIGEDEEEFPPGEKEAPDDGHMDAAGAGAEMGSEAESSDDEGDDAILKAIASAAAEETEEAGATLDEERALESESLARVEKKPACSVEHEAERQTAMEYLQSTAVRARERDDAVAFLQERAVRARETFLVQLSARAYLTSLATEAMAAEEKARAAREAADAWSAADHETRRKAAIEYLQSMAKKAFTACDGHADAIAYLTRRARLARRHIPVQQSARRYLRAASEAARAVCDAQADAAAFLQKRAVFAREVMHKRHVAREYLVFLARREAQRQAALDFLQTRAIKACAVRDARARASAFLQERARKADVVVRKQESAREYLVALATEAGRVQRHDGTIWDVDMPYDDGEPDHETRRQTALVYLKSKAVRARAYCDDRTDAAEFLQGRGSVARGPALDEEAAREYLMSLPGGGGLGGHETRRQAALAFLQSKAVRARGVCDKQADAAAFLRERARLAQELLREQMSSLGSGGREEGAGDDEGTDGHEARRHAALEYLRSKAVKARTVRGDHAEAAAFLRERARLAQELIREQQSARGNRGNVHTVEHELQQAEAREFLTKVALSAMVLKEEEKELALAAALSHAAEQDEAREALLEAARIAIVEAEYAAAVAAKRRDAAAFLRSRAREGDELAAKLESAREEAAVRAKRSHALKAARASAHGYLRARAQAAADHFERQGEAKLWLSNLAGEAYLRDAWIVEHGGNPNAEDLDAFAKELDSENQTREELIARGMELRRQREEEGQTHDEATTTEEESAAAAAEEGEELAME